MGLTGAVEQIHSRRSGLEWSAKSAGAGVIGVIGVIGVGGAAVTPCRSTIADWLRW